MDCLEDVTIKMRKQKIIPVIAIPAAVFVLLLAVFPSLFIPSYKAYEPISVDMEIEGIKDVYGYDEPIAFAVSVKSFGYNQPFPHFTILLKDVTEPALERRYMTHLEPSTFPEHREKKFYFPLEEDEKISFDKDGKYTLRVFAGTESVEKDFLVSESPYIEYEQVHSPRDIAIRNIKNVILSGTMSLDGSEIRQQADEHNLSQFSAVMIQGLKDQYQAGETVSFTVTTFGYIDWCIMPRLLLYFEDQTEPLYERHVVHTCPFPLPGGPSARIMHYDDRFFPEFPACKHDGIHKIVGESFEFGPRVIGKYYCNGEKKYEVSP